MRKSKLIIIIIVLLALAGGAAFWINSKGSDKKEAGNNNSSSGGSQTANADKVYDVSEILKDFKAYEGKEITLKGTLVRAGQGYVLVSIQNTTPKDDEGNSILVNFDKNEIENPDKYAVQGSTNPNPPAAGSAEAEKPAETKPEVTIKGKLTIKSQVPVIEAVSISSD